MSNKETTSCCGCAFLYAVDIGYSNYTVTETVVKCALGRNKNLKDFGSGPYDWEDRNKGKPASAYKARMPYDWSGYDDRYTEDNWKSTNNSRCKRYFVDIGKKKEGIINLDVDGQIKVSDFTDNAFIIETIEAAEKA